MKAPVGFLVGALALFNTVLCFVQDVVHTVGHHLRLLFEECTCVFDVAGHLIRMCNTPAKSSSGFCHEQITESSSNYRAGNDIRPGTWTVCFYIHVCVHFPLPSIFDGPFWIQVCNTTS